MRKMVLIFGVCLALIVASLGCGGDTGLKIGGEIGVSAAVTLTKCHIESLVHSMEVMAMTEDVKSGDWEGMLGLLKKFKQDQVPAAVWFVLQDGSYFTVTKGKTDKNLKDRAYFPGLMAGNTVIGNLVVSKSTGKKSMIAAVPVKDGGKVIGALGVSVFLDNLSEIIVNELQLPDDMVFYAVNEQGQIALHSDTKWILDEDADLRCEKAVSKVLPLTGWRFTLGSKS